jgi:small subunit ribosomal protein S5
MLARLISTPRRFFSSFRAHDPKTASFSPLSAQSSLYKSPYATAYPTHNGNEITIERPYERLITVRKMVRVSAKGKHMKFDAWCLVGNRNGSAGVAHSKSTQAYKAVQSALAKARRSMKYYALYQGRTLYHDIDVDYRSMKMRLLQKPAGYSVRAQRNAYDVCQALGIQDLAVKIMNGTTNPIAITRAIFHALDNNHKTPSQVANARGFKNS